MINLLKTPRYPKIRQEVNFVKKDNTTERCICLETILRKKSDDGLWYIVLFRRTCNHCNVPYENKAFATHEIISLLNSFHTEIYTFLVRGIIGEYPDIVDLYGNKIFVLDPDQREEEERLLNG